VHVVTAMDGNYACAVHLAPGLDVCCEPIDPAKGAAIASIKRFRCRLRETSPACW